MFLCSDAASYITGQPKRDQWWIYSRLNRDLPSDIFLRSQF
ncbi:SDR family oxidoreductase [Scytonema sp. HK-05]|nr:SDR family oxidoreductase [Scytonema sp. HK-05]